MWAVALTPEGSFVAEHLPSNNRLADVVREPNGVHQCGVRVAELPGDGDRDPAYPVAMLKRFEIVLAQGRERCRKQLELRDNVGDDRLGDGGHEQHRAMFQGEWRGSATLVVGSE